MTSKARAKLDRDPLSNDELKAITAVDFSRIKLTDEEKGRLRTINEERARERKERAKALGKEEAPILRDLELLGFKLRSVWDFVNTSVPYPGAIPILLDHLLREYSDRTKEGLARALAVPDARSAWPVLVTEYRRAPEGCLNGINLGAKDGLAAALSATATDDVMEQLVDLIKDRSNGKSRLLLLRALRKSKTLIARDVLLELSTDPLFEKEINSWKRNS